jgi:hypothetical protein
MAPLTPAGVASDRVGRPARFASRLVPLVLLVLPVLPAGCSSPRNEPVTSPTTTLFAGSTAPTGPPVSTSVPGEPVSGPEAYAAAGLTPEQSRCVGASGVDDSFTATALGDGDAPDVVLEADGHSAIVVPSSVTSGVDLELRMLTSLAARCAPTETLTRLAQLEGAADDAAALDDDLPERLLQRKAVGATPNELDCIEKGFREAPALLSSLVANPRRVESACTTPARLLAWWRTSITRGLTTAGATPDEIDCLLDSPDALAALGDTVQALSDGTAAIRPDGGVTGAGGRVCLTTDRLGQVAIGVVAKQADFGAESLSGYRVG